MRWKHLCRGTNHPLGGSWQECGWLGTLVARNQDRQLPFEMLSDGVRNMLAMVGDIAYRTATLNPHLRELAPSNTPGIVLIDELDLHLHPLWQREVVDDLRSVFPAIQFVATSHSPFIIQSLRRNELINLDDPAREHRRVRRNPGGLFRCANPATRSPPGRRSLASLRR
ncbi:AAA family ATPase [Archangium lansingense]|uniref:AAA family ATPase n=1 Tax=Archangium lansingense TaxID=2995310 RepID=UPI003B75E0B4